MLLNLANLAALRTAYNAAFKDGFAKAEPLWQEIATPVPSSTASNLYAFLGQFPALRKWVGDRVIKNMATHAYTVVNDPFEATVGVPRDDIEDDSYGVFSTLMSEMGYAVKMHPDEIIFALLLSGATDLCYDGQAFFDTSHPIVSDGAASTASNYDATGGGAMWCLLDTRRPLKPMIHQMRKPYAFQAFTKMTDEHVFKAKEFLYGVDGRMNAGYGLWQLAFASLNTLNSTNFDAAVTDMMELKSDEDKPLGIRPNLLICGPSSRAAARLLVQTQFLASGADNPNFNEVKVIVSPHMV